MEESGRTAYAHPSSNPCVLVQEAVKAMLRCLGLETAHDHPDVPPLKPQDSCPPPSTAQASDTPSSAVAELDPPSDPVEANDPPTTGAVGANPVTSVRSSVVTRPPINPGSGPQTN
ncbi:hypothetical protein BT93_H3227 [Corymbia citriodora subsp. variegata]|nr:hypothetical protein BT93_H3227 [Corymbia citriodora subsp. variegata]